MAEPESRPGVSGPSADDTTAREGCASPGCTEPVDTRRVILLDPDGADVETCGPYCADDTDALVRNLFLRYSDGSPAYRIERTPDA